MRIEPAADSERSCRNCIFFEGYNCFALDKSTSVGFTCQVHTEFSADCKWQNGQWVSSLGSFDSREGYLSYLREYRIQEVSREDALLAPDGKRIFIAGQTVSTFELDKLSAISEEDILAALKDWDEKMPASYKGLLA